MGAMQIGSKATPVGWGEVGQGGEGWGGEGRRWEKEGLW